MTYFQQITTLFAGKILPILIIICLGYIGQRRLSFDIRTLNRINLYIFMPGLLLSRLLSPEAKIVSLSKVAGLAFGNQVVLLMIAMVVVCRLWRFSRDVSAAVCLASMYGNSGNYGLPLIELVFGTAGVGYQAIVLTVNIISAFSLGIIVVSAGKRSLARALTSIFRQPVIYAMCLALLLRWKGIEMWQPVATSLNYLGDGLIPVALLTLGAQLAEVRPQRELAPIFTSAFMRLLIGPTTMFCLVRLFGVSGLMARVLVLGAGTPAAVNTAILAIEFDNRPSVAASIVLLTTLLSTVTITFVLFVVEAFF